MAESAWKIAGRMVSTAGAVDYLLQDYPALTLYHYDLGGKSPRDSVTMADLGRATLFGAFRGWKAAAGLLRAAEAATWPTGDTPWRLDAAPDADPPEWLARSEVRQARDLFSSLASGAEGGWREAAASKVLHLKWPDFFPVIDGELRRLYSHQALQAERHIPGSRRRKRATTIAYWIAVRQDLLRPQNMEADKATRAELGSASDGEKAARLAQLTRSGCLTSSLGDWPPRAYRRTRSHRRSRGCGRVAGAPGMPIASVRPPALRCLRDPMAQGAMSQQPAILLDLERQVFGAIQCPD